MTTPILLVEDDLELREALSVTLRLAQYEFVALESAELALSWLAQNTPQLIVTDFRLPGQSGLDLLKSVRHQLPETPVVMMTAYADTNLAVQALQAGAKDFLIKPFLPKQLLAVIQRQMGTSVATDRPPRPEAAIVAADPASIAVVQRLQRVAKTDATVLLMGESGVGKDVFARELHQQSSRKDGAYVALNCAAIPENLLESTLFGYEKGAFTGAHKSQAGKFEQASQGTLFLDEIGEMPLELQAKLLRVLQDQKVERLGSNRSTSTDVRVIAATNRDLLSRVREGQFREDLYFRLAVFPTHIPALRERPLDILPLAEHFLAKYGETMGRPRARLASGSADALLRYPWPGNIRELENAVQRALLLTDSDDIHPFSFELQLDPVKSGPNLAYMSEHVPATVDQDIESVERQHILKVLQQVQGNRKAAVEILGLSERALRYKLKAYKDAGFQVD